MSRKYLVVSPWLWALLLLGNTSLAADIQQPMPRLGTSVQKLSPSAALIACPDKIHGVNLSADAQYNAPSGWAPKLTPTGYQGLTLVISLHQVLGGKLYCSYAKSSLPTSLRLTSISKNVPAGKTCTAVSGFKFECK